MDFLLLMMLKLPWAGELGGGRCLSLWVVPAAHGQPSPQVGVGRWAGAMPGPLTATTC